MVWVKLDDHFHSHPKVGELEPRLMLECMGLNLLALSWCGEKLTDGHLPKGQPARLAGRPVENLIGELVRVGLWERIQGGFQIHDFLDYNPSRERVESASRQMSIGGRRGAEARWGRGLDSPPHRVGHRVGHARNDLESMGTLIGGAIGEAIGYPMGSACPNPIGSGCPEPVYEEKNIEAGTPVDNSGDFRDLDLGEEDA